MQRVLVRNLCVCNLFKEPFILVLSNLLLVSIPDRLKIVQHLSIKLNRIANELRELLDDLLNLSL